MCNEGYELIASMMCSDSNLNNQFVIKVQNKNLRGARKLLIRLN